MAFGTWLKNAFSKVKDFVGKAIPVAKKIIGTAVPIAKSIGSAIGGSFGEGINKVADWAGNLVGRNGSGIKRIIPKLEDD